jgi:hypothetical protein
MTTNITQLAVDLATLTQSRGAPGDLALARHRARMTLPCILGFVTGCMAGAVLEVHYGLWALALPATLAALAVPLGELWGDGSAMADRRICAAGAHDGHTAALLRNECGQEVTSG